MVPAKIIPAKRLCREGCKKTWINLRESGCDPPTIYNERVTYMDEEQETLFSFITVLMHGRTDSAAFKGAQSSGKIEMLQHKHKDAGDAIGRRFVSWATVLTLLMLPARDTGLFTGTWSRLKNVFKHIHLEHNISL